jgi:hypothetical protein
LQVPQEMLLPQPSKASPQLLVPQAWALVLGVQQVSEEVQTCPARQSVAPRHCTHAPVLLHLVALLDLTAHWAGAALQAAHWPFTQMGVVPLHWL